MALRAVKPEQIVKRLKMFMYGPRNVGKSIAALQFPNAVIFDLEKGTENYAKTIARSGSVVLQTSSPQEIEEEVRKLMTEKHPYKTVILDPLTEYYGGVQELWGKIFSKYAKNQKESDLQDWGARYWGRVKAQHKSFLRMLKKLDMNVIVTAHQKDIYGDNMKKIGVGPDSEKSDEYVFDLVFQLENPSGKIDGKRIARRMKERAEIGEWKFPEEFEWSYENFCKFYGSDVIEKESVPLVLATPERIRKINALLDIVRVESDEIAAWFKRADVDSWEEMTDDVAGKIQAHLEKKLETVKA